MLHDPRRKLLQRLGQNDAHHHRPSLLPKDQRHLDRHHLRQLALEGILLAMTLSEMASFVCGIVQQSETDDLDTCKSFCTRRFDMVWRNQLWKDSLFSYT